MKCLIIAAGQGNRLSHVGVPKPLLPLLGLKLIERTILTAQRAGINEFYVVTGYKTEKVEEFLSHLSLRKNLKIHFIRNDEWQSKENGISVLKAKNFLHENFILLMADHIFEEATLIDLIKTSDIDDEVVLAADFKISGNKLIDVNDVTKVLVKDLTILDIGKNIKEYNAYDTGMFLCSPCIFRALEESSRKGDSSLSGGMKILSDQGKDRIFDIKDHYWMDIDTPEDWKKAKKMLYRTLTKPSDGWISRKINRKVSTRLFTPLILKLFNRITPNIVTMISAAAGILAALFFLFHKAIIGGILVQLASILDGCDGEIARLKKMESSFGKFFDAVLDRYTDCFIIFGMFCYSLTSSESLRLLGGPGVPLIFLISGLAIVGNVMVSYTSAKSLADFNYRYKGRWITAGRGRDLRLFILFSGGVMAALHPISVLIALFLLAAISNAIVLKRVFISWKFSFKKDLLVKREIRAVILDFDGTVADTMPFLTDLATRLMVENYNISEEEARRKYLETSGLDFASQMELIFPNHTKNRHVISSFEAEKRKSVMDHPLFPEVIRALKFFKRKKIPLFVCSSTPQEIINEYLRSNRIHGLVDGYFGLKPDFQKSRQIDFILEHYNLRPDEVLFAGDSFKDSEFAKNKGIEFVGITGTFKKCDFQEKGLLCVDNLRVLTRLWAESEKYLNMLEEVQPQGSK